MNIQEQIRAFRQKRNEAVERRDAIMKKSTDEGRTLEAEEKSEFDGLQTEIKHIDDHIERLNVILDDQAPPESDPKSKKGTGPTILVRKQDPDDQFKGQSFTRRVIARAIAQLSMGEVRPGEVAEARWGKSHPNLVKLIKAGVPGGSATGAGSDSWGAELVDADSRYVGDFLEFLADQTVFDRLPLREVPANVRIKGQDGIGTGYWVGESNAIPVSAQSFSAVDLEPLKVAAISVASKDLLMDSTPAAERLIRDGLATASGERVDTTFLSNSAASAGVSPAGMLNGIGGLTSAGVDADGVLADIAALYAPFITARNAGDLQFVTNKSLAKTISLMRNALGQREFPELGANGGTLAGDTVVTGDNVGATHLILLKPSEIWKIGDTGVEVSLSMDATIEQDSAPQGDAEAPTAASATLMSMFQTENVAFKIVRRINFQKRRTHAVQWISDAAYSLTGS